MNAVAPELSWEPRVADKKTGDKTETVRVRADLADALRIICTHDKKGGRRVKAVEVLDELLRGPLLKRRDALLQAIAEEQSGKKKPKE